MVVPSLTPDTAKPELRAALRSARKAFVAGLTFAERHDLEASLVEVLAPLLETTSMVAGYHAIGSEIDPQAALTWAGNHGISMALPAFVDANSTMIFRSGTCAEDGPHGIPQPPHQAKQVDPDLILVPLLAVDRDGVRIGQGGGHYDRVLGRLRFGGARIVGLGWAMQSVDFALPNDPWDVPLDGFASPAGLVMFR